MSDINLLQAHGSFGLKKRQAAVIIERVASVTRQWRVIFEEHGVPQAECDKVASAFRRQREIGMGYVDKVLGG